MGPHVDHVVGLRRRGLVLSPEVHVSESNRELVRIETETRTKRIKRKRQNSIVSGDANRLQLDQKKKKNCLKEIRPMGRFESGINRCVVLTVFAWSLWCNEPPSKCAWGRWGRPRTKIPFYEDRAEIWQPSRASDPVTILLRPQREIFPLVVDHILSIQRPDIMQLYVYI